MGVQKDDKKKGGGEKKLEDGGGAKKADAGSLTVVLKLDLHCDGCAKKVKKSIRHFEGVESVNADIAGNKLTITGKVDPTSVKERVEHKTRKKVELISPQPKKDDKKVDDKPSEKKTDDKKAGDKPSEKKSDGKKAGDKPSEKKSDDKKADAKKPEIQASTIVLKIPLHCEGCVHKIKRTNILLRVELVIPDVGKDLVTVKGTMNVKELTPYLKDKLRRSVDIVPSKTDEKKDDKKEKTDGTDKKEKVSGGDGEKKAVGGDVASRSIEVVNKLEYYGQNPYTYTMPTYNQGYYNQDYGVSTSSNHGYINDGYVNHGYAMQYPNEPPRPPPMYLHDPRVPDTGMFSDENPNGCSVM
ncbi:Heavy metal-associated domain, HMA [Cynara cardunculus var. scolymus]|uniref:Heavy metal-associated domain, HMA n=1 Tax=Cynara cardunculus var. scolymus TaxID=59895 RepID=A0A118JZJ9_CYNCS|nr:Heavy metal-associated domain, HMA [Cynara cardunculus var. scolymus]